jgi:hypothetical protein
MASSKLFSDLELISVTRATDVMAPPFWLWGNRAAVLVTAPYSLLQNRPGGAAKRPGGAERNGQVVASKL